MIEGISSIASQMLSSIDRSTGVVVFNPDGIIEHVNDKFVNIFGYLKSDLLHSHHSLLLFENDISSEDYKRFWNELKQGRFVSGEFRRRNKDGVETWISGSYNPIIDENGKVKKVIKFAVDITKQKKIGLDVHQKIQAIEKSNAVAEFDLNGNIISVNKAFCSIFSYDFEELEGHHHRKLLFHEDDNLEYQSFWERLARGEYCKGEFRRKTRLGKEVWIRGSYNPIFDSKGKIYKFVKYALDVTQEKNLFREYEGRINAIDRSNAVIEFDINGNILRANENFLNIFDYAEVEIIGNHHRMFLLDEDKDSEDYLNFWKALARGEFRSDEFRRKTRQGHEVWIRGSYNPIFNSEGKVERVIKFALDVTEQKKIADELTQDKISLEAQSKLVALGQMAAGIAHEVNNPLSIMSNKIEECLDEIKYNKEGPDLKFLENQFNGFIDSIDRISRIIKSLRAYAKQEERVTTGVDVHDKLKHVLDLTQPTIISSNINLTLNLNHPVKVSLNHTDFTQVIINLINNAIYALKDLKGPREITISDELDSQVFYILRIQDSGLGVPEDIIKKVFDPFFTSKGPEGTGLGLSLSAQAMKGMGGDLKINQLISNNCFEMRFKLMDANKTSNAHELQNNNNTLTDEVA